ncbi:hypothetical protein Tco_1163900 [Tanacetum coccineum]
MEMKIQTDAKSTELQKYRDEQEQMQTDTDSDRQQQIQTDTRHQIQTDIIKFRFKQTAAYSDRQQQIQQIYSATNRQVYSGRHTSDGCRQKEPTQQYPGEKRGKTKRIQTEPEP